MGQSIPYYCMSTFLLPKTLVEELQKSLNTFWCGLNAKRKRKTNWYRWDKLYRRKEEGGFCFRSFHEFNLALLAKQGWTLLINPDSLVARLLKARYFCTWSFLTARLGYKPSFIWRELWTARSILEKGCRLGYKPASHMRCSRE